MIFVNSWFEIDEAADCLGAIPRNINLRFQGDLYKDTTQMEDEAVRKRLIPVQFASGQHKRTHCLPTGGRVCGTDRRFSLSCRFDRRFDSRCDSRYGWTLVRRCGLRHCGKWGADPSPGAHRLPGLLTLFRAVRGVVVTRDRPLVAERISVACHASNNLRRSARLRTTHGGSNPSQRSFKVISRTATPPDSVKTCFPSQSPLLQVIG